MVTGFVDLDRHQLVDVQIWSLWRWKQGRGRRLRSSSSTTEHRALPRRGHCPRPDRVDSVPGNVPERASPNLGSSGITRITPDWCGPRETIEEQAFVENRRASGDTEVRVVDQPEDRSGWRSDRCRDDALSNVSDRGVLGGSVAIAGSNGGRHVRDARSRSMRHPMGLALDMNPSS